MSKPEAQRPLSLSSIASGSQFEKKAPFSQEALEPKAEATPEAELLGMLEGTRTQAALEFQGEREAGGVFKQALG